MRNGSVLVALICLLLGRDSCFLVPRRDITTGPDSTEKSIPESEERLRKVGFDTPALMVHIVIAGVVGSQSLQRVPGQGVAAVIVDCLESRSSEKPHSLPRVHTSKLVGDTGAKGIEQEALDGMIVESTVSVRNVETMMTRMDGRWES